MDLDSIDYDLDGLLALIGSSDSSPLERIARAQWAVRTLDDDLRASVREARTAGHSWAEIGDALGMTRQAAHERFRQLSGGDLEQIEDPAIWANPYLAKR